MDDDARHANGGQVTPGSHGDDRSRPRPYHHGDLRRALLAATREVARDKGPDGVTLREVARRARVSHAAPYHHFPDRVALLRALATEAFETLTAELARASASQEAPARRLGEVGRAYVRFALAHRVEFRFMFRAEIQGAHDDAEARELRAAGDCAYRVLQEAIAACRDAGLTADTDPHVLSLAAWSIVHGLAELMLNDPRLRLEGDADGVTTTDAVLDVLTGGLLRG